MTCTAIFSGTCNIMINNLHIDEPILINQYNEIGHLTEGPVSSDVKYLRSCSTAEQINEVQPLNISPDEDGERWITLLKAPNEDKWQLHN